MKKYTRIFQEDSEDNEGKLKLFSLRSVRGHTVYVFEPELQEALKYYENHKIIGERYEYFITETGSNPWIDTYGTTVVGTTRPQPR